MEEQVDEPQQLQKKVGKNSFQRFGFCYELYKALVWKGFRNALPIQKKAIPIVLEGRDAIVSSRTGSGKTLTYVLPLINRLKCHSQIIGARALILIPTRELALQIASVLKDFTRFTDLRYALLLGGHSYEGQFEVLAANPDIIIATPGRLMQLLVETDFKLSRVEMLVFDEADSLFEKGFEMQMGEILRRCPVSQKLMFSATIPEQLSQFANSGLRDYVFVKHDVALPEKMSLDFYILRNEEKLSMLLYLLEQLQDQKVIVFASTRYQVDFLAALISKRQQCLSVYGKMEMDQRNETINAFRAANKGAVLVVTDLAARGLDVPEVNYVVHFDYPSTHKIFVHRSGRTARKGEDGHTISLVNHTEVSYMIELCHYVGRKLLSESNPSDKEVAYYGTLRFGMLSSYDSYVSKTIKEDSELEKLRDTAEKAMQKFKKCRTPASSFSVKLSKELPIKVHPNFEHAEHSEQQSFLERIHNYNPQKSFLELQRIRQEKSEEDDPFLQAIGKIRTQQKVLREQKAKRQSRMKQLKQELEHQKLNHEELEELKEYKERMDRRKEPIQSMAGMQIEIVNHKQRRSQIKDFRKQSQFIENTKQPRTVTEFDQLQKIGQGELDNNLNDEGRTKNRANKRVWDKASKTFKFSRDKEDRMSKDQKGKVAYQKWKKTTHLSLQKVGDVEDTEKTSLAKDYWTKRRRFAKGWKENKQQHENTTERKRNEVIRKKIKKRMIGAAGGGRTNKKGASKKRKTRH